jgi:hypothetical protein
VLISASPLGSQFGDFHELFGSGRVG